MITSDCTQNPAQHSLSRVTHFEKCMCWERTQDITHDFSKLAIAEGRCVRCIFASQSVYDSNISTNPSTTSQQAHVHMLLICHTCQSLGLTLLIHKTPLSYSKVATTSKAAVVVDHKEAVHLIAYLQLCNKQQGIQQIETRSC